MSSELLDLEQSLLSDIDVSALPIEQRPDAIAKVVYERTRQAHMLLNSINAIGGAAKKQSLIDLVEHKKATDPNYIHHQINDEDITGILQTMVQIGLITRPSNNQPYQTGKQAIHEYAKNTNKHPDWANKVIERTGKTHLVAKAARALASTGSIEEQKVFSLVDWECFDTSNTDTLRQCLKEIQRAMDKNLKIELLSQRVAELEVLAQAQLLNDEAVSIQLDEQQQAIEDLQNHAELHWNDKLITLQGSRIAQGNKPMKQKELAEACGVSLDSIKQFTRKQTTKDAIAAYAHSL
ncbi:hypothetical protein RCJ22_15570 [Vibrio sp. FNV 38]|nr:hypothetical protein [Vibrio sp. FNV 38]